MARPALLLLALVLAVASVADAQNSSDVSPLVDYFSVTNSSEYSIFWTALQAGNLDSYLNDSSLALTVFAPTNAAWLLRLPTLTTANGITVEQLFSQSKSAAVQNMLQYHILNTPQKVSSFANGDFLSTLANLCSDAKTLSVDVSSNDTVTLIGAGGTRPQLLDNGLLVGGKTIVYAINDVLLPSVVTIPLGVALQNFNATSSTPYTPVIAAKASQLDQLQTETQGEALAPVFVQPATPPSNSTATIIGSPPAATPSPTPTAASTTTTSTTNASPSPSPTPTPSPPPGPPSGSGIDTGVAGPTTTGR